MTDLLVTIFGWATGSLWPYLAGAGVIIVSVISVYVKGRADAKAQAELKALREAQKTQERITDAVANSHAGGGAWIDRLRGHSK